MNRIFTLKNSTWNASGLSKTQIKFIKHFFLLLSLLMFISTGLKAQVGIGTIDPDTSVVLDIKSPNKGILLPRSVDLTATRKREGSLVYDSVNGKIKCYHDNQWLSVNPLSPDVSDNVTATGNVTINGTTVNAPNATALNAANATVTASRFEGDGTIPIGGIIMWSGTTVPNGWTLCNGGIVNGYTTPDLSGRFIVGYTASVADYNQPGNLSQHGTGLGKTGGSELTTLSTYNLPTHNHEVIIPTMAAGEHFHYVQSGGNRGPGGAGREPIDYTGSNTLTKTNTEPDHKHFVIGTSENTGGVYTSVTIPNPPPIIPDCTHWEYTCTAGSQTFQSSVNPSPAQYQSSTTSELIPLGTGNYGYRICVQGGGYCGIGFMNSNIGTFTITSSSCVKNSGYDAHNLDCIDSRHDARVPLYYPIHINQNWKVQPVENRPPYYVLAFIMRVR